MTNLRFPLSTILRMSAAAPIWTGLIIVLPQSKGFPNKARATIIVPLVLVGITFAVHRLLRDRPNAWAWSALLAGVIALGSLSIARVLVGG